MIECCIVVGKLESVVVCVFVFVVLEFINSDY